MVPKYPSLNRVNIQSPEISRPGEISKHLGFLREIC